MLCRFFSHQNAQQLFAAVALINWKAQEAESRSQSQAIAEENRSISILLPSYFFAFSIYTASIQEVMCSVRKGPIRFEPRTFLQLAQKAVHRFQTHSPCKWVWPARLRLSMVQ